MTRYDAIGQSAEHCTACKAADSQHRLHLVCTTPPVSPATPLLALTIALTVAVPMTIVVGSHSGAVSAHPAKVRAPQP